eukprot:Nk52_evm1s457 gene=Nk52_evmTU1s457
MPVENLPYSALATSRLHNSRKRQRKRNLICLCFLGGFFLFVELALRYFQLGLHVHQVPYKLAGYLAVDQHCQTPEKDIASLRKVLKDFTEGCEEIQVKYWIDFGTLLGAVRHKGIIPWDNDLDFGIMAKDYDSVMEMLKKKEYNVELRDAGAKIKLVYGGMAVDVFGWEENPQRPGMLVRHAIPLKENDLYYTFGKSFVEPLEDYQMNGLTVKGPNRPMDLIKQRFPYSYNIALPRKFRCYFVYKEYFAVIVVVFGALFGLCYLTCTAVYNRIPV